MGWLFRGSEVPCRQGLPLTSWTKPTSRSHSRITYRRQTIHRLPLESSSSTLRIWILHWSPKLTIAGFEQEASPPTDLGSRAVAAVMPSTTIEGSPGANGETGGQNGCQPRGGACTNYSPMKQQQHGQPRPPGWKSMTCWACGGRGHNARECRNPQGNYQPLVWGAKHPRVKNRRLRVTIIAYLKEVDVACISNVDSRNAEQTATLPREKHEWVWEVNPENLSEDQKQQIFKLLLDYAEVFSTSQEEVGLTSKFKHPIHTGDSPPIRQAVHCLPPQRKHEVHTFLQYMMVKEPSSSPWASPIVVVRKEDCSTRFCVDHRKLNVITHKDAYPLPCIDDTLTHY